MKRFLQAILLMLSLNAHGQVTWDGGGDGISWSDPINWSTNTVPLATDNVLLDNSVVATGYVVNLPSGSVVVAINSLAISPLMPNSITLVIPSTNTANPGLSITGSGDALVVNTNGILKNSTGAAGGSLGLSIAGIFRINNGGRYIHNNERGHATIVNQLSTVAGTELGVFEFDVPGSSSFIISASGRTYGTMVLNAAAAGTKTYAVATAASPLTINGDFQVNPGVNFTWSAVSNIVVKRNLIQQSASFITLGTIAASPALLIKGNIDLHGTLTETTSGSPVVELNGSSASQSLNITGTISGNNLDFVINNPLGGVLLHDLVLPYRLSFLQGNLTIANYALTIPASMGFNSTRHIITNGTGFVKIPAIAAGPVIFPIGTSTTNWNPVTISQGNGKDYSARVETGIIPAIAFPTFGINRTWYLSASSVTTGVNVSFQYATADANAGVAVQPQPMEMLQTDGVNTWNILAGNTNINPTGADPSFVVSSSSPLTINNSPIPYALGKDGGWILPLDYVINCQVKNWAGTAIISWKVADADNSISFEVQRMKNNAFFQTIAGIRPVNGQLEYALTDPDLPKGLTQYRIKVSRSNHTLCYSNIAAIIHDSKEIYITSISPNPAQTATRLFISSTRESRIHFAFYDMAGRLVKNWDSHIQNGNTDIAIDVADLQIGVYQLLASTIDTKKVFRFVKQ